MRRWILVFAVAAGLLTAAFVLTDTILEQVPGVTEANVGRIRKGMTEADVEALFAGPGTLTRFSFERMKGQLVEQHVYTWTSKAGEARVCFIAEPASPRKVVQEASFFPTPAKNPLARLVAWLGW